MSQAVSDLPVEDPFAQPIEQLNVAQAELFQADAHWDYFKRLRDEAPVHFCADSDYGPYWSISRFQDIFAIDNDHQRFSSARGIGIGPPKAMPVEEQMRTPMFIAMDPPKHDVQRATVAPVVAPGNLAQLEGTIRQRAAFILDGLPVVVHPR